MRDEGGRAGGAVSLGLQEEVTGYDGRGICLACFDEPGMASSGQRSDHADAGLDIVQGHQRLFQPPVPPDLSAFRVPVAVS